MTTQTNEKKTDLHIAPALYGPDGLAGWALYLGDEIVAEVVGATTTEHAANAERIQASLHAAATEARRGALEEGALVADEAAEEFDDSGKGEQATGAARAAYRIRALTKKENGNG